DGDGLFADSVDGVAVPAADPAEADLDATALAWRRDPCLGHILDHLDVERRALPEAANEAGGRRLSRRIVARLHVARRLDGALLRDQLFPSSRGPDPPSRAAREPGGERAARNASLPAQSALSVQHAELDLDAGAPEADRARQCDACAAVLIPSLHARQRADRQGDARAGGGDPQALSRDREDALRGSLAAPLQDRVGDDWRPPSLAPPAAAHRKCDQICGDS